MSAPAIECPNCGTVIHVPIESVVEDDNVVLVPDLSDVWLHSWSCDGSSADDEVIEVQFDPAAVIAWDGSNPMRKRRRWWRR